MNSLPRPHALSYQSVSTKKFSLSNISSSSFDSVESPPVTPLYTPNKSVIEKESSENLHSSLKKLQSKQTLKGSTENKRCSIVSRWLGGALFTIYAVESVIVLTIMFVLFSGSLNCLLQTQEVMHRTTDRTEFDSTNQLGLANHAFYQSYDNFSLSINTISNKVYQSSPKLLSSSIDSIVDKSVSENASFDDQIWNTIPQRAMISLSAERRCIAVRREIVPYCSSLAVWIDIRDLTR
jgi:hypothetical protein